MTNPWSEQALTSLGVPQRQVGDLASNIAECLECREPVQAWKQLVQKVLTPNLPFELHRQLYVYLSNCSGQSDALMPVWWPTEAQISSAHLTGLMAEVGAENVHQLHAWTSQNPFPFWETTIQKLGVRFRSPPQSCARPGTDPRQPVWLPGARLNIAETCFQAPDQRAAIIWRKNSHAPLETITYQQLWQWSGKVANGLRMNGFEKGDAIAIDMVMNPESVAIYLGILRTGCAVISIADSFSPAEIATRLRIGKAKGIFTMDVIARGGKTLPMYEKVTAANAPKAIVLPAGEGLVLPLRAGDITWEDFLPEQSDFETEVCDAEDIINILFSSGTTGDPKAIIWDHTTPLKGAMDAYYHHNILPGEVVAWPTNLGWMMGPWLIFATLVNQATIALFGDAPTGREFCEFVQDAKVNMLGVVPSLVKAWRQQNAIDGLDWCQIRAFSSTGECSNAEDMHFLMAQAGYKPVLEYCGGTEVGGGYLCGSMIQPAIPATFTTPSMGLDFVILNEDGEPADNGELYLVPPSIGLSSMLLNRDHAEVYYRNTPVLPDGRLLRRHGDQIMRLSGGHYRAEGRADDTMNLGGIKVSSAEIERVLNSLESVMETAAIAVSPKGGGPGHLVIFAVMACAQEQENLTKSMQKTIRKVLNPLFKIHDVCQVDSLPRTASGKVMRRKLREMYQNR